MTYDAGIAECDKCGNKIDDGNEVYCRNCIDRMQVEVEELRETVNKLQEENTALDENVDALAHKVRELTEEAIELEKELAPGGRVV